MRVSHECFIRGKHVGGADVINNLFQVRELAKIFEGIQTENSDN
ncbi:uncharacterized protein G2W53_022814 [Senna tora]|uniref:Uncharacterized protein n=1 Tax=Senna tora TaxID=362788 RepID=A0A834TMQ0_9FABA|nr:uncharacterized protein G2W53_022814 [Senna tora]